MHNPETIIVIPARYGSTRFPGKPLVKLAGKTLLQHVCNAALAAASQRTGVTVLIATDDERILQHAKEINVDAVLTPESCATGTDRVIAAIRQLQTKPQFIINLQGDAPLTPPAVLSALIDALQQHQVVTPVMQLSWQELDTLRNAKQATPFSGTTVIVNAANEALWFSKQIIPAIRNEEKMRKTEAKSPVLQHLGIYGYTTAMLEIFASLPEGYYEKLEGLEQLRLLENGYTITTIPLQLNDLSAWRGVDTNADAEFVERLILGKPI